MKRTIRQQNNYSRDVSSNRFWAKLKLPLAVLTILLIFGVLFFIYLTRDLPSLAKLERYEPELATKIYSRDGVVIKELFTKKRILKPLGEMPRNLILAVLDTEDRDFYNHWGLNFKRMAKAIMIDVVHFKFKQGASTLTQQLARQLYLNLQKTIVRKLREIITAIQIERTYTKDEILEMYLNHMYFGNGAYGAEAAAQKYFDKSAKDLTLPECAMLAGILQRPTAYSPYRNPELVISRRNVVLFNMFSEGHISRQEYEQAKAMPLNVRAISEKEDVGIAPYFTEFIRQKLQKEYQMDLYTAGLSVYTTLDTRLQACAERAVSVHLKKLQSNFNKRLIATGKIRRILPDSLTKKFSLRQLKKKFPALLDSIATKNFTIQVAFIAMDPTDGSILAMIGGRDFRESKYNRAVQMRTRQPGSTFKPIVYTAAIDNGYSPSFELLNQPVVLYLPNGDRWAPHNYDHSQGGPTTLRQALKRSLNLVTARLVQEVVPPKTIIDYARKLGLTTELPEVDALALGSGSVSPIEMTTAFGVFANQGILAKPMYIAQIIDKSGNIIKDNQPEIREVLRRETAYIMADMLQGILSPGGTGYSARSVYGFQYPAGGKTGTTNDFTDAWFIGFTRQIVAGVWVGFDDPAKSLGNGQAGSVVALPIWARFMKAAHDTLKLPPLPFEMPPGVVRVDICKETKKLATEFCPEVVSEIFKRENAPTQKCDKHTALNRRRTTNKKARKRF
ncbi:MAG: PBP1A family penicillin-binding protein [Calditrichaeota bacterium]|nr:PBP1A family penicillin-binding protein [Calditrichota bacterium]